MSEALTPLTKKIFGMELKEWWVQLIPTEDYWQGTTCFRIIAHDGREALRMLAYLVHDIQCYRDLLTNSDADEEDDMDEGDIDNDINVSGRSIDDINFYSEYILVDDATNGIEYKGDKTNPYICQTNPFTAEIIRDIQFDGRYNWEE